MGQLESGDSVKSSPQGEEGPPSLEYIQAKDLFPPKELVKEEENLQVRRVQTPLVGGCYICPTSKSPSFSSVSSENVQGGSECLTLAPHCLSSGGKARAHVCVSVRV